MNKENRKSIKFSVFADFHYKKYMYPVTVENLKTVLSKAKSNNVDFVIHCGDLCNQYCQAPELVNAYLENEQGLRVYGVYGNHELESADNSMAFVTQRLNNDLNVILGDR